MLHKVSTWFGKLSYTQQPEVIDAEMSDLLGTPEIGLNQLENLDFMCSS